MPPFFGGDLGGFAHFHVAKNVFQHHDRVVNQAGKGQRQASQDHGVDRTPQHTDSQKGGQG